MSIKQDIVVIHAGTKVSPFLGNLIEQCVQRKIRFKVIASTLLDFPVPGEKDAIGGWISKELIALASSIIKDDLTSSPLASLFTRSKSIEIIKQTPSEQFLASWFSDMRSDSKTAFEKVIQVFDQLINYSSLPMKVYPLSYQQKKPISIKYRNQNGSPRAYQMLGYLDLKKKTVIDPNDIEASMKEEKKDFDIEDFDEKESIIPAEIEKILKEADAIIISADDFFSLAIMLKYIDVRKSIKKSQGSVLTIAPIGSRFTLDEKTKVLLEMFGIQPDIQGFLELMKDVSDTLCIDSGDSEIVSSAHESGFNVIIEDLIKIENKQDFLSLILKGAGLEMSSSATDAKAPESNKDAKKDSSKKGESEQHVAKENVNVRALKNEEKNGQDKKTEEPSPDKSAESTETESKVVPEKSESHPGSSKLELSATVAKSVAKTTSDAEKSQKEEEKKELDTTDKSGSVPPEQEDKTDSQQQTDAEKEQPPSSESSEAVENNTRELLTNFVNQISDESIDNLDTWVKDVDKLLKKDESGSIQVANNLLSIISQTTKDKVRNNTINVFLSLSESRKITFRNVLLSWLLTHLGDPDFTIQNTQYDIIRKMILNEKYQDLIGETLDAFINQLLTSEDMNSSKQERGRLLVQRIAYNSRKLSKYAIKAFLELFEDEQVSHNDIWPGLSSFDARLVGIELVEGFSVQKSRSISEEVKRKELGSFSTLLEDIVSSWEKGDMNRLTLLCGSISESAFRKAKRLSLAQNIKKVGTVPLEILARSLKEDPKELETLVYEMMIQDELNAKLEIVDGRLYIIPIEIDDEKSAKEKPDPIELKKRLLEMKEEAKVQENNQEAKESSSDPETTNTTSKKENGEESSKE